MSHCMVPNWNQWHQRQEVVAVEEEESKRSSHVHNQLLQNPSHVVPLPESAAITWQNGQLAMHGLSGIFPTTQTKPTWGRTGETLESIVDQATCHKHPNSPQDDRNPANIVSFVASSTKKRTRSESDQCGRNFSSSFQQEHADRSAPGTTMMTWTSFESPRSMKTRTIDEVSACLEGSENREENEKKAERVGFHCSSSRRSRAAAVHNLSERRRRDRISQKMKALQKLVPYASKTDKASMLDEVIEYLKKLQAQVQMMSIRTVPQMMTPAAALGMQQQIQMSLLARMGMDMGMGGGLGLGMGMVDMSSIARAAAPQSLPSLIHPNSVAATAPAFVPPTFLLPSVIPARSTPQANPNATATASVPLNDPYCLLLAQSINMELYNKMAPLYRQVNHATQAAAGSPLSNHIKGG